MKLPLFIITGLLIPCLSFGQIVVTGRVIDSETKKPINEVTVIREGTNIQAVTNILGYFQLAVDSNSTILFKHKEYETGQVKGPVKNNFQVQLHKDVAPDGFVDFYKSLSRKITYPARAVTQHTQGRVYVSFEVDSISGVKNIQILRDIGNDCGKKVVKVIENSSDKWIPKSRSYKFILPVTFRIESINVATFYPGPIDEDMDLPAGEILTEVIVTAHLPPR